jgi:mannose-6-phosphate isomerase
MPRIWGAHSLAPLYPDKTNLGQAIGEAWLTGPACEVESGPFSNRTLPDFWREMPPEWRGTHFTASPTTDFPILVKFLFPADQLSIQVHPDDAYAKKHEFPDARGKTEMWHAVSADPGAELLLGLRAGVTRQAVLDSLKNHTLENLFHRCPVHSGESFFVAPGTAHAIGPGVVLCEVQQSSDLTYRLYDFGRTDAQGNPRQLHIDKAMDVTNFEKHPENPTCSLPSVVLPSGHDAKKSLLAACSYFASERWDLHSTLQTSSDASRFELLVILSGNGNMQYPGGSAGFKQGECWFIPASLGNFSLTPGGRASILRTYVPDLAALRSGLAAQGVPESALKKVIFN